jgi:hypothetical protein
MTAIENHTEHKAAVDTATADAAKNAFMNEFQNDHASLAKAALKDINDFDREDGKEITRDGLSNFLKSDRGSSEEKAVAQILYNNFDILDKMGTEESQWTPDLNPLAKDSSGTITPADLKTLLATSSPEEEKKIEDSVSIVTTVGQIVGGISGAGANAGAAYVIAGMGSNPVVLTAAIAGGLALAGAGAYALYKEESGQTTREMEADVKQSRALLKDWK